jgi:molybdenum storage protein
MPPGVLAQLAILDALGNAHLLGTLLAPHGVVAIPPEILGHLLPFFLQAAPGVIFSGDPPFSLWEHPPHLGRIPPHRSDTGSYLLAECFGCATVTLLKDVDGLYDRDPKLDPAARFIPDITVAELKARQLPTLPFDRVRKRRCTANTSERSSARTTRPDGSGIGALAPRVPADRTRVPQ